MEFHEKLQMLRKQRQLTQEELAKAIYVSRTAISKWESGRGYPSIDSLKAISRFFSVPVDELLSGKEMVFPETELRNQREIIPRDVVFGLLDCSVLLFFFLPVFGHAADGATRNLSLLALNGIPVYLQAAYLAFAIGTTLLGLATLALQKCRRTLWLRSKYSLSLLSSLAGIFLFIISRQPYAAALILAFLIAKAGLLIKKR